ncbi:MAG TPA: hypothetical protein VFO67_12535, partial [Gemmatimonadales bacterium]|nr:hypothetical protein [Gemmatimonadales bacterium]
MENRSMQGNLQHEKKTGQHGRREKRLHMDPQCLAPNLRELGGLLNGTGTRPIIHVALTARRESNSGLGSSLKQSERAEPERKEREQAPRAWRVQADQQYDEQRGRGECDESEPAPLCLSARSDVRDRGDGLAPRETLGLEPVVQVVHPVIAAQVLFPH